jgi:SAM-dependent methyltransferase
MERIENEVAQTGDPRGSASTAWALQLFDRSLKKRQKLDLLLNMAGPIEADKRCLLLTCGDNPGALNHHFRNAGGKWTWGEIEPERIEAMSRLLGDPVAHVDPAAFPFADASFDLVILIDVHEHLEELDPVNREVARVVAPGGVALLTTPNGDERLPVAVVKRMLGMTPEIYGHQVQGYTQEQLEGMAQSVGLVPEARGAYSKFFTEAIELVINFGYVKVLPKRAGKEQPEEGEIAPGSEKDLNEVGGAYKLYSALYPILLGISKLDRLIPGRGGYAVAIAARKPA